MDRSDKVGRPSDHGPPQVLGFTNPDDFKAYYFKHFVHRVIFANRGSGKVRVVFTADIWIHAFWDDGRAFDLQRAERLPWILEALEDPEEILEGHTGKSEVYILTKKMWGEDFCVVIRKPNRKGVSYFITAYPPDPGTMLKIRTCNPRIWP